MATSAGNLQNLNYYSHAVTGAVEYKLIATCGKKINSFFHPVNAFVVNPLTNVVTDRIALPTLKKLYSLLGNSAVQIVRCVNSSTADRIEEGLNDPVSTETLLMLGDRVQSYSLQWGKRSPIKLLVVENLDICSIVAARHIYIFASDMKSILATPAKLRDLTDIICIAADEEIVQPLERDGIECGRSMVKNGSQMNEEQGGFWGSFSQVVGGFAVAAVSTVGGGAAVTALSKLRQNAHDLINQKEKTVRQKIVGKAVHSTCRAVIGSTTRNLIKAGAGFVCYKLVEESILLLSPCVTAESIETSRMVAKTASACLTTVGAFLFMRYSPTINRFYNSYNQGFDAQASTIRELASCVGQENVDSIVETVQTKLNAFAPQGSYLDNFAQRVAGQKIELQFEDGTQPFIRNTERRALLIEDTTQADRFKKKFEAATKDWLKVKTQESCLNLEGVPNFLETVVTVKCKDLPNGQTLFIRGNAAGLNWHQGVPLVQLDWETFQFKTNVPFEEELQYKFLINDDQLKWEAGDGAGDNHKVAHGKTVKRVHSFNAAVLPPIKKTVMQLEFCVPPGKTLFISGTGPLGNWDQKIPMRCVGNDNNAWFFSFDGEFADFKYKLLLDDVLEQGDNRVAKCGSNAAMKAPRF